MTSLVSLARNAGLTQVRNATPVNEIWGVGSLIAAQLNEGGILDFTRFCRQISTSSSKLLKCHRAQLAHLTVRADSIVETLNAIKHVWLGFPAGSIDVALIRSFFKLLENDSATVLSQQFPRRLMLGTSWLSLHQQLKSSVPNWPPWFEWIIIGVFGRLRHTAIISASSTNAVAIVEFMDQPTTEREYKSITAVKYSQPS